jgi:D-lactate dehydrogenase (cytochrome)
VDTTIPMYCLEDLLNKPEYKGTDSQDILEGYLWDASNIKGHAEGLLRPSCVEDVSVIVKECQKQNIPVTISAQRTATTGSPVPFGGVVLSMEMFDRIHSRHEVDAGVVLGQYQQQIEDEGWFFPPDPTSRHECSVGGAISCNASGARSFKYGSTRPWVEGLEVVFPNGDIRQIDRKTPIPSHWPTLNLSLPSVKTAAGYEPCGNLLDLMIGQEGTLGVITKAWLKTIPNPMVLGLLVFFDSNADCLRAVHQLKQGAIRYATGQMHAVQHAISPCSLEYFDRNSIVFMRAKLDDLPNSACGLFIELESRTEDFATLEPCLTILESCGALMEYSILADSEHGRNRLYQARHAIPASINEIVAGNGMPKVGTDFAVPDNRLEWIMDAYAEVDVPYVLFGHIGDNHLHLNMLPSTEAELMYAKEIYVELARIALSYGGTVSAEHGIGKLKKQLLAEQVGAGVIEQFRCLKNAVDPNWILGRGTLFDRLLK